MKFYLLLTNTSAAIAGLMIPLIMIGISADVFFRYALGSPIGWIFEFTEHALLCIPFLGMAWLVRERSGHVAVEILFEFLGPVKQRIFRAVAAILAAAVCLFITYYAFRTSLDHHARNILTIGVYPQPKFVFTLIVAYGMATTGIAFLIKAYEVWKAGPIDRDISAHLPDQVG